MRFQHLMVSMMLFSVPALAFPERIWIPAGSFKMGCSADDTWCEQDEGPAGGVPVEVDAFHIDQHETSVAEYRRCVEAGQCESPFTFRRTHYCNYAAPGRDNYPVNCVNWHDAHDYCEWRGGRLATEAEWEKAARGNTSTPYFWGHKPANCEVAVMDPGSADQPDTETDGCYRDLSWPRGSFAPNPFGLYDMIGGTSEWVANWYAVDAYAQHYAAGDLIGPEQGTQKVIKGGSWDEKHWAQRVSNRFAKPTKGNPDLYGSNGIRCVYDHTINGSTP